MGKSTMMTFGEIPGMHRRQFIATTAAAVGCGLAGAANAQSPTAALERTLTGHFQSLSGANRPETLVDRLVFGDIDADLSWFAPSGAPKQYRGAALQRFGASDLVIMLPVTGATASRVPPRPEVHQMIQFAGPPQFRDPSGLTLIWRRTADRAFVADRGMGQSLQFSLRQLVRVYLESSLILNPLDSTIFMNRLFDISEMNARPCSGVLGVSTPGAGVEIQIDERRGRYFAEFFRSA